MSIRGPTQGGGRSDSGSRGEMGGISRMRVIVVRSKEVCLRGQAIERGGRGGEGRRRARRSEAKSSSSDQLQTSFRIIMQVVK